MPQTPPHHLISGHLTPYENVYSNHSLLEGMDVVLNGHSAMPHQQYESIPPSPPYFTTPLLLYSPLTMSLSTSPTISPTTSTSLATSLNYLTHALPPIVSHRLSFPHYLTLPSLLPSPPNVTNLASLSSVYRRLLASPPSVLDF